jgi:hypothetical protein
MRAEGVVDGCGWVRADCRSLEYAASPVRVTVASVSCSDREQWRTQSFALTTLPCIPRAAIVASRTRPGRRAQQSRELGATTTMGREHSTALHTYRAIAGGQR